MTEGPPTPRAGASRKRDRSESEEDSATVGRTRKKENRSGNQDKKGGDARRRCHSPSTKAERREDKETTRTKRDQGIAAKRAKKEEYEKHPKREGPKSKKKKEDAVVRKVPPFLVNVHLVELGRYRSGIWHELSSDLLKDIGRH